MWLWVKRPTKRAILVLGAPRSGTSAVSHVLSEMGVNFGDPARFVDPAVHTHNPIFFELVSLNALNDAIFDRFGTSFGAFDWIPDRPHLLKTRDLDGPIARFMADEFGDADLVGLKDPRFCFTLPIWQRALTSLGYAISYVVSHRSAEAVFASNRKVNGLPAEANFRLVTLCDLLPKTFLKSETDVAHVTYEELIASPLPTCKSLATALRLDGADSASKVIDADLRHDYPHHQLAEGEQS